MLGKAGGVKTLIQGSRRRGQQKMRRLDGITDSMLGLWRVVERVDHTSGQGGLMSSTECPDRVDRRVHFQ